MIAQKPPLCKGRWQKSLIFDGGIVRFQLLTIPQSACSADSFPPGKPCGGSKQPPYNICSAFSEKVAQKGCFALLKLRIIPTSAERFTQLYLPSSWSFDHNTKSTDLKCGRKEKKLRYFSYFVEKNSFLPRFCGKVFHFALKWFIFVYNAN